ncbi:tRNA lysidine(34) synthetase TilS [Jiella mangrovi]|uniref:tRNA(Ile)-lysidine synthase n=1 Tax=Jiella mangrovi TaxID=2821407 RepID=A0ABS4BCF1_9HYPH|nr:tRNA lysidine(34) synthetase TilS [Jiella mangrovi]MBP0614212.1 tRNA lysidine(34) synthetase TilS [Jiella mangrovi]
MPPGDLSLSNAFANCVEAAMRRIGPCRGVLLAVSGGPDSLALLLAASASRQSPGMGGIEIRVATVDHRLRPQSAREAEFVAAIAARHGLSHETLVWNGWDGQGNLSAHARDARYEFLLGHARAHDLGLVLVAHHRDDDIETHVMRRERGADILASAGMRKLRWLGPDVLLGRPFLDFPREDLAMAVAAEGVTAVDDPSNRDPRYDRARIRLSLARAGGSCSRSGIRLRRCKRARQAAERGFADFLSDIERSGRLRFAPDGSIAFETSVLAGLSDRCAAHLVSRAVTAASGNSAPPSVSAARKVVVWLRSSFRARKNDGERAVRSIGGALVEHRDGEVVFFREAGRNGIAGLALLEARRLREGFSPRMQWPTVFDGRFVVDVARWREVPGARLVALGALGLGGRRQLCLPVLVDAAGAPIAAPASVAGRLGPSVAALDLWPLALHSFSRDLPLPRSLTASSP